MAMTHLSDDGFYQLFGLVEEDGGTHIDNRSCKPKAGRIKGVKGVEDIAYDTYGCKRPWLFLVPYDLKETVTIPSAKDGKGEKAHVLTATQVDLQQKRGGGFVTACASGDRMDLWPRFAKRM